MDAGMTTSLTPYYQDDLVTLYCGDCLEVFQNLPSRSFECIVTDPPYAIPTVVAAGRSNTRNVGDLSLIESAFRRLFEEFDRVLSDDGRAFIFCDGNSYPVIFRAMYGRMSTALLIWNKGRIGMGREFRKSHELIMHAWKAKTPVFSDGVGRPDVIESKPVGPEIEHPAQKPVDLIHQLLKVSGRTVLDPFMGSGSVAIACRQSGRRFTGIEIEKGYCDLAKTRILRTEIQPSLIRIAPVLESLENSSLFDQEAK